MPDEQSPRSRRSLRVVGGVLVVGAVWAAWFATRPAPIRIGVSVSGETALGHEALLAVRFFVDERPEIGGRPVELVVETPSLAEESQRAAYRRLVEAGVEVVVGAAVSQEGVVQAEEAERSRVACFSVSASTSALTGRADHFHRLVVATEEVAGLAAEVIGREHGRLVVFTGVMNRAYTEALGRATEERFAGETLWCSLEDEAEALGRARAFEPEAAFLVVAPNALVKTVRLLREQLPGLRVYSSDWGLFALPLYSGADLEGVRFLSQNGTPQARYAAWLERFQARYQHKPSHTAAYCVSIMELLYLGLEEVGGDGGRLAEWLVEPRTYDYAYGRVHLDRFGDAVREFHYLYEVRGAEVERLEVFEVPEFVGLDRTAH